MASIAQDQWTHRPVHVERRSPLGVPERKRRTHRPRCRALRAGAHYDAINCDTLPGMTCWKSWSPRVGGAYDLFGNGKTALKVSCGKYMTPDSSAFVNLFNPVATFTESRTWTDLDCRRPRTNQGATTSRRTTRLPRRSNPNFGTDHEPHARSELHARIQPAAQRGRAARAATRHGGDVQLVSPHALQHGVSHGTAPSTRSPTGRRRLINPLDGTSIPGFLINRNKATGVAPDLYLTNMTDDTLRRNIYTGFETRHLGAASPPDVSMFAGWTFERTIDVDCTLNTASASATLNSPNS